MVAFIIGIAAVIVGAVAIVRWFEAFVLVLKGSVPAMFVCGGLLAIIAGITSIKDAREAKKLEEERKKEGEQK